MNQQQSESLDRLFNFLGSEGETKEELKESFKKDGIDIGSIVNRGMSIIEECKRRLNNE